MLLVEKVYNNLRNGDKTIPCSFGCLFGHINALSERKKSVCYKKIMILARKQLKPYYDDNFDSCIDEKNELLSKIREVVKIRETLENMSAGLYDVEKYCCQAENAVKSLHQLQDDIDELHKSIKREVREVR